MPLYYLPGLTATSQTAVIEGEEFTHLARVMRVQPGQEVLLSNGQGMQAKGVVSAVNKRDLSLNISALWQIQPNTPRIAAAFALLKNKHDLIIVEKLTELGVAEFFPVISQRSVRQAGSNTTQKFEKTAIAALKQCDGAWLPRVHQPAPLPQVLASLPQHGYQPLVASEIEPKATLPQVIKPGVNYCIFTGPEGGFSPQEFDLFASQNVLAFKLGNHIVRAETAAIAALAQLQVVQGMMK